MSMIEEIYQAVLPEMASNGIEDTPSNRLAFLEGMAEAWDEDTSFSPEKPFWRLALSVEMTRLRFQILHPKK